MLYPDLKDRYADNAGSFAFLSCPSCGFIWLSPRPSPEDMGRFYLDYYTHAGKKNEPPAQPSERPFGRLRDLVRDSIVCGYYGYRHIHSRHWLCCLGRYMGGFDFLRERAVNENQAFPFYVEGGFLIDVGCGNGEKLFRLKQLGWEVLGIETDSCAAEQARGRMIRVESRPLEKAGLPDNCADVIIMNHVVEHLYDPVSTLRECRRLLKNGGRLVIFVPNALSLGHEKFGRSWLALDPPRHLSVFSPATIKSLLSAAGFSGARVRTSSRWGTSIYNSSRMIAATGHMPRGNREVKYSGARFFGMKEFCLCALGFPRGEDMEAVAIKK